MMKYVFKWNVVVVVERESCDCINLRWCLRDVVVLIIEDFLFVYDVSIGISYVFFVNIIDVDSGVDIVMFQFIYFGGDEVIDGVFVGDDIWEVSVFGLLVGVIIWFVGVMDVVRLCVNYVVFDL